MHAPLALVVANREDSRTLVTCKQDRTHKRPYAQCVRALDPSPEKAWSATNLGTETSAQNGQKSSRLCFKPGSKQADGRSRPPRHHGGPGRCSQRAKPHSASLGWHCRSFHRCGTGNVGRVSEEARRCCLAATLTSRLGTRGRPGRQAGTAPNTFPVPVPALVPLAVAPRKQGRVSSNQLRLSPVRSRATLMASPTGRSAQRKQYNTPPPPACCHLRHPDMARSF